MMDEPTNAPDEDERTSLDRWFDTADEVLAETEKQTRQAERLRVANSILERAMPGNAQSVIDYERELQNQRRQRIARRGKVYRVARGVAARRRDNDILDMLSARRHHAATIAKTLGITRGQADHALWRLINAGKVVRLAPGIYALATVD